ncbi:MAG: outer membrane protein assembly factor BamA [Alphaproteobacteria bacterium]|nr:outer membrane protein assembly factor BamA [Alphaproteobacteria bacterium]MBU0799061.1 outer membrane protein assembly factor BamA [Alphaproteobacteria bacterium]MBU0886262.1 outer membrane protein assembly factor BamA [Alphaproteobacteria bacterium]MBU1815107.1 outer membrane protein assembly factor BamA [Alphaproteobacteria bacterium]
MERSGPAEGRIVSGVADRLRNHTKQGSGFYHVLRVLLSSGLACWLIATGLVLSAVVPSPALAQVQVPGGGVIANVRVEGSQRIDPATVLSYLNVRAGDTFDPLALDQALKTLFATGLFADVSIRREASVLVVRVVENPIINRIAFEGNKRIDDEALQREVQLRPRVVYTRTKVQNDVQRILDVYRRSGRFAATVEPKVIQLEQNRVDLAFEINEGDRTEIRRISFVGNKRFSDRALREEISTKETAWYRFLSSDDSYDPDRLTFDREKLRRYYLRNGYADFRVLSAVAELTPDKEAFYITFTVEEGERYKFGKVDVQASLKGLDPAVLNQDLTSITEGDWYNASLIDRVIDAMTERLGNLGYAFVDIQPQLNRNREARTVDLTLVVREGPRVYVEDINIKGNVRTLDRVIRREMRLVEGDAYNTARIRRSQQRIRDLNFFSDVKLTTAEGSSPDKTKIDVEVTERSTGELSFGFGVSTRDALIGDVRIRERNLLGRGQDLSLGFSLSARRQEFDIRFTEPYFMDKNIAAGFDLFRVTTDYQDESSYDLRRDGGTLRAGYQITEHFRHTVRYTLSATEIRNVDTRASFFIRDQEGKSTSSVVGNEFTYDRRDNRIDPRDGYILSYRNDVSGLGGDTAYIRNSISGTYYYPLSENWTLSTKGEVGNVTGYSDKDVGVADRYFLGGANLRGFEYGGVGPRDITTNDSLGAENYYTGTVEVLFPLGFPKEMGVRGGAFTDFGSAWDVAASGPGISDIDSLRASVGVSFLWESPMGPLRLDFAKAVLKEEFDEEQLFRFSFGTRF